MGFRGPNGYGHVPAGQGARVTLEGGGRASRKWPGGTKRANPHVRDHGQDKRCIEPKRAQVFPRVNDEGRERFTLRHSVLFQEGLDGVYACTREFAARLVDGDVHVNSAVGVTVQVSERDRAAAGLVIRTVKLASERTLELRTGGEPGVDVHGQHLVARVLGCDPQVELKLRRAGVDPRGLREQLQAVGASGDVGRRQPLALDRLPCPGWPLGPR